MKLLILALMVGILAISLSAFAGESEDPNHDIYDTSRGIYTTPFDPLTEWLNTNEDFYHSHDIYIPSRRNPVGVGVDMVLYESQNALLESVTAETRYDFGNDELSAYGVVRVNAFKAITNLLK